MKIRSIILKGNYLLTKIFHLSSNIAGEISYIMLSWFMPHRKQSWLEKFQEQNNRLYKCLFNLIRAFISSINRLVVPIGIGKFGCHASVTSASYRRSGQSTPIYNSYILVVGCEFFFFNKNSQVASVSTFKYRLNLSELESTLPNSIGLKSTRVELSWAVSNSANFCF